MKQNANYSAANANILEDSYAAICISALTIEHTIVLPLVLRNVIENMG